MHECMLILITKADTVHMDDFDRDYYNIFRLECQLFYPE